MKNQIGKVIAVFILILIFLSITVICNIHTALKTISECNIEVSNSFEDGKYDQIPDIYYNSLKNFNTEGKEYYYSFIELEAYEYPILALSEDVYQDETKSYVALGTNIYYYVEGEVSYLGELYSDGTAYPISADKTGIFTAGGHRMAKYNLDVEKQVLHLIQSCKVYFNMKGEATYIATRDNNIELITSEEFEEEYKKYTNAKVIYFTKLTIN